MVTPVSHIPPFPFRRGFVCARCPWRTDFDQQSTHSITSGGVGDADAGSMFDSGIMGVGGTFSHTFDTAGMFPYYCVRRHGSGLVV